MKLKDFQDEDSPTGMPTVEDFDPRLVPWQYKALKEIRGNGPAEGVQEILLSGSVGSAKSTLVAHIVITHCLTYPGARVCLGRLTLPDAKETIFQDCVDHIGDRPNLKLGKHWMYTTHPPRIRFSNGSEVVCRSWKDKNYQKFRSMKLSMGVVEELSENDNSKFYKEFRARVGRLPHVPESLMICATNPADPEHWAYKYFILNPARKPNRRVFYSLTRQNPFLPQWYRDQLRDMYDPREARRMLDGEWLELSRDVIYHQYSRDRNFRDRRYHPWPHLPIRLHFDFNIGVGKPMSAAMTQYIPDGDDEGWHIFSEAVVQGADTADLLQEIASRGVLEHPGIFILHGDASGNSRDTRSKTTDWDIIKAFLKAYRRQDGSKIEFEYQVPFSNPPVRTRHNMVNAFCNSSSGRVRLWVYRDAPTADEGFRLTRLRDGAQYIEDDSKPYQHITTAVGYGVVYTELNRGRRTKVVE